MYLIKILISENPTTNHLWELAQIKHINARKEQHP